MEHPGLPEDEAGEQVGEEEGGGEEKRGVEKQVPGCRCIGVSGKGTCSAKRRLQVSGIGKPYPEQVKTAEKAEEDSVLFHQKSEAEQKAAGQKKLRVESPAYAGMLRRDK